MAQEKDFFASGKELLSEKSNCRSHGCLFSSSLHETTGEDGCHVQGCSISTVPFQAITEEYAIRMEQEGSVVGLLNVPSSQYTSGIKLADGSSKSGEGEVIPSSCLECSDYQFYPDRILKHFRDSVFSSPGICIDQWKWIIFWLGQSVMFRLCQQNIIPGLETFSVTSGWF